MCAAFPPFPLCFSASPALILPLLSVFNFKNEQVYRDNLCRLSAFVLAFFPLRLCVLCVELFLFSGSAEKNRLSVKI